jgi:predicted ABC-type ATPase
VRDSSAAPSVVLLGGPNGAGKTTASRHLLQGALHVVEFVNADAIARGLSAFSPDSVGFQAGRAMLQRLHELAGQQRSFAFETTLASRSFVPWLRSLVRGGWGFHLVFLWLPCADLAIARVRERVRKGGHDVAEPIVRRRFDAGLANFRDLYRPLATTWLAIDASDPALRTIARGAGTAVEEVADAAKWERILGHA